MKIGFFCLAAQVIDNPDKTHSIHYLANYFSAPQFPIIIACEAFYIIVGTSLERPKQITSVLTILNSMGETIMTKKLTTLTAYSDDGSKPFAPLQVVQHHHIQLQLVEPGMYTAQLLLENGHSMEQTIMTSVLDEPK